MDASLAEIQRASPLTAETKVERQVWATDRTPLCGSITRSREDGAATIQLVANESGSLSAEHATAGTPRVTVEATATGVTYSFAFDAVRGGRA